MGFQKEQLIEKHGNYLTGLEIAIKSKVLKRCEIHEDVIYQGENDLPEPAYKLGNWMISNDVPLVRSLNGDRQTLMAMIQEAIEQNSGIDKCPCCLALADD